MQKGYVFRSQGSAGWWYVRYWDRWVEKGVLKKKFVAKKLTPVLPEHSRLRRPPEYVIALQQEFMARINRGAAEPERHVTLDNFFTNVFLPHMRERRKCSTIYCHQLNWRKEIAPRIGQLRIRDFKTPDAQRVLDSIGNNQGIARQTLFRYKSLMSAVLRHAVNQGYHSGPNPVSLAEVPAGGPSKVMPYYLLDDVKSMLAVLPDGQSPAEDFESDLPVLELMLLQPATCDLYQCLLPELVPALF